MSTLTGMGRILTPAAAGVGVTPRIWHLFAGPVGSSSYDPEALLTNVKDANGNRRGRFHYPDPDGVCPLCGLDTDPEHYRPGRAVRGWHPTVGVGHVRCLAGVDYPEQERA